MIERQYLLEPECPYFVYAFVNLSGERHKNTLSDSTHAVIMAYGQNVTVTTCTRELKDSQDSEVDERYVPV